MPDYSKGKIYKIINNENDKFYIGSTIQPLYKRMSQHREKHHKCMSKNLDVDIKECIIVLVEKVECKSKEELFKKEREYIEKYRDERLNIVNKILPGRTAKEYYEKNKEQKKEQRKKYYEKNKEKILKIVKGYSEKNKETIKKCKKEYYEKNKEKITCECGAIIQKSNNKHKKSKKHLKYIEELNN